VKSFKSNSNYFKNHSFLVHSNKTFAQELHPDRQSVVNSLGMGGIQIFAVPKMTDIV